MPIDKEQNGHKLQYKREKAGNGDSAKKEN
jgi:hypothetical protein